MKPELSLTKHASKRLQQRGLRASDLDLIINAGTAGDNESIVLSNQDVDREIRELKHVISNLERLRGCKVVIAEKCDVVTAYRPTKRNEKRVFRGMYRRKKV